MLEAASAVVDGALFLVQLDRRRDRWENMRALWSCSTLKRVRRCNCRRLSKAIGVPIVLNGGVAHFSNLERCGSIWACPVCSAKIRHHRTSEVRTALVRHAATGGHAAMVTFTIPHYRHHKLRHTVDLVSRGFSTLLSGEAWAGRWRTTRDDHRPDWATHTRPGPDRRKHAGPDDTRPYWFKPGHRQLHGVAGTIRAMEITHGRNGWHPHLHVLVLFDPADNPADALEAFRADLEERWCDWIEGQGHPRPLPGIAVHARLASDPEAAAEYVAGDPNDVAKLALEMTRVDLKGGRGGRTPFQILGDFRRWGDRADLKLWRQYERATKGRQALTWSAGLRDRYLTEDERVDDDQEIAEAQVGGEPHGVVPWPTYRAATRLPGACELIRRGAELAGARGVREALSVLGLPRDLEPPPPPPS